MSSRVPMYGLLVLLLSATSACEATNSHGAAPSKVGSLDTDSIALAVEPSTLRAEFLFDRTCPQARPFGTRVILVASGGGSVHSMRFRFTDRFGRHTLPRVIAIPGSDPMTAPLAAITTAMPMMTGAAPLPAPAPIPMRGSSQLPFFLSFDCGVAPGGELLIAVDVTGTRGARTSELRARLVE